MNLYLEAAEILESGSKTSLKSIVYDAKTKRSTPPARLYALLSETIKFQDILKDVIDRSGILKAERKLTYGITLLFAHDFLFTKKGISASSGPLKEAFMRHKTRVSAEFARVRLKRGYSTTERLVEVYNASLAMGVSAADGSRDTQDELPNPRWIRANTLKTTLQKVLDSTTFREFKPTDTIQSLFASPSEKLYYTRSELLPDIFAINPSHKITNSQLYISGSIIFQSAASCLPALLLSPSTGAQVIDACAAPGNKSTHLAAVMKGSGSITAVEKNKVRAETLETMTLKAGAGEIVHCLKGYDFMKTDPADLQWSEVEYILLDPSCSGSGILNRVDFGLEAFSSKEGQLAVMQSGKSPFAKRSRKRKRGHSTLEPNDSKPSGKPTGMITENEVENEEHDEPLPNVETKDRLKSLSDFQLAIIRHSFAFPAVKRITYSTCSVHDEENEMVVDKALASDVAEERGWTVESREHNIARSWQRRGRPGAFKETTKNGQTEIERLAEGCVRVSRSDGLGGGFFVVCFVRPGPEPILGDLEEEAGKEQVILSTKSSSSKRKKKRRTVEKAAAAKP